MAESYHIEMCIQDEEGLIRHLRATAGPDEIGSTVQKMYQGHEDKDASVTILPVIGP